ncbi:alginate export family protein [Alteraurantiacibacter aquimixticola]|uniref:Alginate export domain-containing protein n=1 Tax=Alteraurantiacibacter aquimixticola TaxID=2489173 RepID=A0A4V4U8S8_9SPHN|nr:alginate export family protein [Alteraurantiacibacter aquimixticola]TIX51227.1 hypothetical protein E5222_01785 [Alteraurantiacibacter aquimixticola]
MRIKTCLLTATAIACFSSPALAAPGDPIVIEEGWTLDLQANTRLRYETVSQDNAAGDADALTLRGRLGAELAHMGFKVLVEGEGTAALIDDYNDTQPGNGVEPFSVVADPENMELNRIQVSYSDEGFTGTLGRQRVIMGNARFVGNVGWRQNEQTFDAARLQVGTGPFKADAVWAISQRTIFGVDSPNEYFDGNFVFLNAGVDLDVVDVTAFSYIVDYDTRDAFSSQTFGATASAAVPLGAASLDLSATYATQADAGSNPVDYSADFISLTVGTTIAGFNLSANYEELGSDDGVAAFQTPMATLHAFQGWADLFLTTPATGVRDYNVGLRKQFSLPGVGNVTAAVIYHDFDSDFGGIDYGSEWDASLGFKVGPVGLLLKYANYDANAFAVDTEKFWLQAEYSF